MDPAIPSSPPLAPAASGPDAGASDRHDIADQIRQAADATGVPFEFLLAKANQESRMNPSATNRNSTAVGLFQFTESTWLEMIRAHGSRHGLEPYAQAIGLSPQGTPKVDNQELLREILDLRKDPRISALMAGEYARDNRRTLEARLGRTVSTHDLYLAHFLGAAGALRLLEGAPDYPAADHLPHAAAANPSLFNDSNHEPRSTSSLVNAVQNSFDRARSTITSVARSLRPAIDLAALRPEERPTPQPDHLTLAGSPVLSPLSVPTQAMVLAQRDPDLQPIPSVVPHGKASLSLRLPPPIALGPAVASVIPHPTNGLLETPPRPAAPGTKQLSAPMPPPLTQTVQDPLPDPEETVPVTPPSALSNATLKS